MSNVYMYMSEIMAQHFQPQQRNQLPHVTKKEIRLVLVGRTGEGKSATGNSILGRTEFDAKRRAGSVTKECQMAKEDIHGKLVLVVDTPGLFDTREGVSNQQTLLEITKCLTISSPGPHAFLLTMSANNRFTAEMQETLQMLREVFGQRVFQHTIVVITGNDQLDEDETTVEEFLKHAPDFIKDILKACDNRYIAFNNRLKGEANSRQVKLLLKMVDGLVKTNGNSCFSSVQYDDIEKRVNKEEARRNDIIAKKYKLRLAEIEAMITELETKLRAVQAERQQGAEQEVAAERQQREQERAAQLKAQRESAERRRVAEQEAAATVERHRRERRDGIEAIERQRRTGQEATEDSQQEAEIQLKEAKEEKERIQLEYDTEKYRVRDKIREDTLCLTVKVMSEGGAAVGSAIGGFLGGKSGADVGKKIGGVAGAIVGTAVALFSMLE